MPSSSRVPSNLGARVLNFLLTKVISAIWLERQKATCSKSNKKNRSVYWRFCGNTVKSKTNINVCTRERVGTKLEMEGSVFVFRLSVPFFVSKIFVYGFLVLNWWLDIRDIRDIFYLTWRFAILSYRLHLLFKRHQNFNIIGYLMRIIRCTKVLKCRCVTNNLTFKGTGKCAF